MLWSGLVLLLNGFLELRLRTSLSLSLSSSFLRKNDDDDQHAHTCRSDNNNYTEQQVILGTHTSDGEQNHLMLATVRLPHIDQEIDARQYNDENDEVGGFAGAGKIQVKVKINHDGEVNRARHCPQNKFVIATKTVKSEVHIFDTSKFPSVPVDNKVTPNIVCKGHSDEGYGIDWNRNKSGYLASGSNDHVVCVWDTNAKPTKGNEIDAIFKFDAHSNVVEDVKWHGVHGDVFGSVSDSGELFLYVFFCSFIHSHRHPTPHHTQHNSWDLRKPHGPTEKVKRAHDAEINCLSFNRMTETLLLTGSTDKTVALWDLRKLDSKLHVFQQHRDEVLQVAWAPFGDAIFASSSGDRRINVWDMSKIGQEQTPEDAEDGPPELLFIHGGHTSKVSDFSWNPNENEDWVCCSVAEDNIVQVWQIASNIINEEEEEYTRTDVEEKEIE